MRLRSRLVLVPACSERVQRASAHCGIDLVAGQEGEEAEARVDCGTVGYGAGIETATVCDRDVENCDGRGERCPENEAYCGGQLVAWHQVCMPKEPCKLCQRAL